MENSTNNEFHYNNSDIILKTNKSDSTVNTELLKPFNYLNSIPGKNIRKTLVEALNYWMKIPQDKLETISQIVCNLHGFSLLVDDIQDKSILRRGIPAAHTVFGILNTALSAKYVDNLSLEILLKLNNSEAIAAYIKTSAKIWAGQGMELYWRDNFVCPTEEEYLQMITRKTGGLFMLAKQLIQAFSTTTKDVDRFLLAFGLHFQILDDYQNLKSQVYFDNKGFCEDLSEGKFSFPIVHAINSNPKNGKIIKDIISQRTNDVELKKYCISVIEKCGSFEYTRKKIKELQEIISDELHKLGENPYFDKCLSKINSVSL